MIIETKVNLLGNREYLFDTIIVSDFAAFVCGSLWGLNSLHGYICRRHSSVFWTVTSRQKSLLAGHRIMQWHVMSGCSKSVS